MMRYRINILPPPNDDGIDKLMEIMNGIRNEMTEITGTEWGQEQTHVSKPLADGGYSVSYFIGMSPSSQMAINAGRKPSMYVKTFKNYKEK